MKVAVEWTVELHSWPCHSVYSAIMPVHRKAGSSVRLHGRTLSNYSTLFVGANKVCKRDHCCETTSNCNGGTTTGVLTDPKYLAVCQFWFSI